MRQKIRMKSREDSKTSQFSNVRGDWCSSPGRGCCACGRSRTPHAGRRSGCRAAAHLAPTLPSSASVRIDRALAHCRRCLLARCMHVSAPFDQATPRPPLASPRRSLCRHQRTQNICGATVGRKLSALPDESAAGSFAAIVSAAILHGCGHHRR